MAECVMLILKELAMDCQDFSKSYYLTVLNRFRSICRTQWSAAERGTNRNSNFGTDIWKATHILIYVGAYHPIPVTPLSKKDTDTFARRRMH
ncbi:hypothetical protein CEXT_369781 [Caerostris extrusa]|uniref:Uncharacterized protein n=1 Tax=Caerostris extrusa TaxID=172846 RepID=A0AAV4UNM2_CAEEX|nr:hypothetical protein CEXT_369781 [Caerostris extrusa]